MAFGKFSRNDFTTKVPAAMADINVTPMVDVMLVLLVIFIITAPLMTQAIKLELPAAKATAAPEKPTTISLSFNAQGQLFWGSSPISFRDLEVRLSEAAQKQPQPELQLRADKATRYEIIAQVMAVAQAQGLDKIGFVTDPGAAGSGGQSEMKPPAPAKNR
ncbi:biopolymer transporter ExbD [Undibacterium sp. Jales W-56]|uniref:ExbD/TolR family protein n=1 Tax=Undibacterium sp. Jales W-56 TaxID=2897325 RepID=UPI0021D1F590|nr:biopolymer transporter ExbD [Undibacterium sp. Jales W-56]MCU6434686.1 biopolymer transporter ExbD [Undibacterium sp. Jales W-56]